MLHDLLQGDPLANNKHILRLGGGGGIWSWGWNNRHDEYKQGT